MTNTLAYHENLSFTDKKSFITLGIGHKGTFAAFTLQNFFFFLKEKKSFFRYKLSHDSLFIVLIDERRVNFHHFLFNFREASVLGSGEDTFSG
jgi:hypothetical protein